MPARDVAAIGLSKLMRVLLHVQQVRIIEELRHGEVDVNTLRTLWTASAKTNCGLCPLITLQDEWPPMDTNSGTNDQIPPTST